jgi:hypothetical protein
MWSTECGIGGREQLRESGKGHRGEGMVVREERGICGLQVCTMVGRSFWWVAGIHELGGEKNGVRV